MQSATRMRFQTMPTSACLYVQLPIMQGIQRSATETSFYILDEDQGLKCLCGKHFADSICPMSYQSENTRR